MSKTTFGRVQLRIMRVLWERGSAKAREISEALNHEASLAHGPIAHDPIAHSTVHTLLRKLEEKQAIGHRVEERTFVYFPLVEEERATRSATRDLIERTFGGSAAGLVAWLLRREKIAPDELREIKKLIDEKSSKRGPRP